MLCLLCCIICLGNGAALQAGLLATQALDLATRHLVPTALAVTSLAAGAGAAAVDSVPATPAPVQRTVQSVAARPVQHWTQIGAATRSSVEASIFRAAPPRARPALSKAFRKANPPIHIPVDLSSKE